ncbi:hypothetical protein F5Y16DRAFT_421690 [Xylariaceae sp. FL0255]|nr:hypothetical protein F5Y16DRAFT_421690 [Xylariaceae sp. FL0255]
MASSAVNNSEVYGLEERAAGSQGRGMFTTKSIPRHSLLLKESPILTVDKEEIQTHDNVLEVVSKKFSRFSEEDQNKYLALSTSQQGLESHQIKILEQEIRRVNKDATKESIEALLSKMLKIDAVWCTNSVSMKSAPGAPFKKGVFPTHSRLNHSCAPNAHWRFDKDTNKLRVVAMRDLAVGEEVLISYVALQGHKTRKERHDKLGFTCACPACNISSGRERFMSDARRKTAHHILQSFLTFHADEDPPAESSAFRFNDYEHGLHWGNLALAIAEKEQLLGDELMFANKILGFWAANLGRVSDAIRYYRVVEEHLRVYMGENLFYPLHVPADTPDYEREAILEVWVKNHVEDSEWKGADELGELGELASMV